MTPDEKAYPDDLPIQITSNSNRKDRRLSQKKNGYKILGNKNSIVEYPNFGRKIMRKKRMEKISQKV